ncbi:MAG TPA: ABC transporter substrate-binding protein, partial [Candidatus Sumerlaeota bacterium]|nr:ABC transporter substrate-binding protein [Candidatus Sumerlaeota bacterium]
KIRALKNRHFLRMMVRGFVGVSLCLSAMLSGAQAPKAMEGHNPAAKYLPRIVEDAFNPDVTDANRGKATPQRGGKFRIRTPASYQHLNRLLVSGQEEMLIINHLSDSLVERDPETLEFYPGIAWCWKETDIVKKKDGAPIEGRIIARDDETVTFVPDAWRITYALCDLAKVDEAGNSVTLKEDLGGATVKGKLTVLDYTVQVDEGFDSDKAAKKETIAVSALDTWDDKIGSKTESRPFAKINTAFQFLIRKGVTWQDGEPFTAEDVKFSYETVMNTTVDAQRVRNYYQDVTLCEVMPDGTTVHFQYGKTYFKALEFVGATSDSNYLIPRHIFKPEQYGGDEKAFGEAFNAHPFREKPVYTGPYRVKEWKRGDTLTLERNPNYWKNNIPEDRLVRWKHAQPYLDEISFVLYRDPGPTVKDLMNGVIDADFNVEPSTWVQPDTNSAEFLAKMIRVRIPYPDYTYIGWNLRNPLFKDVNVRRALAMLVPRDEIIKNVYQDVAVPANGPFYRFGPGYDSTIKPIDYDPAGAKKLLTRAGWLDRDGDGVLEKEIDGKVVPFRFRYAIHNARDYHQKVADIIKEKIGQAKIDVTIIKSDWAIYADMIRDKNFDATRFASTVEIDPDPFQIFHSSQMENKGDNFFSYSNPKVDDLCVRIRETIDPETRWGLVKQVHQLVFEDQPICFLESFDKEFFVDRRMRGIKFYAGSYPQNFTEFWWSVIPENRR